MKQKTGRFINQIANISHVLSRQLKEQNSWHLLCLNNLTKVKTMFIYQLLEIRVVYFRVTDIQRLAVY